MSANFAARHPSRPQLALRIGVTGHRSLPDSALPRIEQIVGVLLGRLAGEVQRIGREQGDVFAGGEPRISILSQLAAGADQLVSRAGLQRGFAVEAVLPFAAEQFANDFASDADRAEFQSLLLQTELAWHLPGKREKAEEAYATAGEATIAQSDLLIAIWDGEAARGMGGTADVVEHAIRRGVPVIHIPPSEPADTMLLWGGDQGHPSALLHRHNVPRHRLDNARLASVLSMLLKPPADAVERRFLLAYANEKERRLKLRPEYPLLLAVTGVRRLRRSDFLATEREVGRTDALTEAYFLADSFADHYAQTYRSGSVFNFVAAAAAVIVAMLGFVLPAEKAVIVVLELLLIGGLIVNTYLGNRGEWHRRWLDYRYLAEKLRLMRSLKQLSVARPEADLAGIAWGGRWTDFYAASLWRQLSPNSTMEPPSEAQVASSALTEIESQILYHQANAGRMHRLDHRLHHTGTLLFYATAVIGLVSLTAIAFDLEPIKEHIKLLTLLSAALPTVGSALFGLRGQGDFAGAAGRSARTAAQLQRSARTLRDSPVPLARIGSILEDAARAMLDDLDGWRTAYTYRRLLIPA